VKGGGEEHGRRVNWEQKADRGRSEERRQNVFPFTADVAFIEWPHVVIPVERKVVSTLAAFRLRTGKMYLRHRSTEDFRDGDLRCDSVGLVIGFGSS